MAIIAMNDTERAIYHIVSAVIESNILTHQSHFRIVNNRIYQVSGLKSGYTIHINADLIHISIYLKVQNVIDVIKEAEILQEKIATEVYELIGYRVEHIHLILQ